MASNEKRRVRPALLAMALVLAVAGQVRPCSRAAAGQQPRTPPTVLAP